MFTTQYSCNFYTTYYALKDFFSIFESVMLKQFSICDFKLFLRLCEIKFLLEPHAIRNLSIHNNIEKGSRKLK